MNIARLGIRAAAWCGVGALVVLSTRVLAYALAPPTALVLALQKSAGGPELVVVAAIAIGLGLVTAAAIIGAAAIAVRDRLALEERPIFSPLRLRVGRAIARFVVLTVVCLAAFAYLESYIHWRAGLGWHGIHCLIGPVHRDAIPLVIALSLVAVAIVEAVEHLLAWARRTFALLFPHLRSPRPEERRPVRPTLVSLGRDRLLGGDRPRGPPGSFFLLPAA
ncbi:MAG TPA: hypothetical protein VH281_02290 [Gaiellaceae bacterium]